MNYKDLFKNLKYTNEAREIVGEYLSEPIAYRIKAEPGWKLIALVPIGKDDVEVDFIDIEEWVFFTSLHFSGVPRDQILKRSLIKTQMEQSLPRIPDNYNGKLKDFFKSIQDDFPNWNHVTFPSLMIGCTYKSSNLQDLEIKAKELWKQSLKRLEEEEEAIRKLTNIIAPKDNINSVLDGLFSNNSEKSKLN